MSRKFVEKESHATKAIKKRWRMPRGKHSKVRQMHKGRPALPNAGYGKSVLTRGQVNGLYPVLVCCEQDLKGLDAQTDLVIIARAVGLRKRVQLFASATKAGFKVHNVDADIEKAAEKLMKDRKKIHADRVKRKTVVQKTEVKKAKKAPAKEAKEAPAKEAKEAPAKEAKKAPAKEAKEAPAKEAKKAPAKKAPAKEAAVKEEKSQ